MLNKKLHICIVTGTFPALTETFITAKVLELHKRGHRITVIENQQNGPVNSSHLKLVKEAKIEVLSFIDVASLSQLGKAIIQSPASFIRSFSLNRYLFKKRYKQRLQSFLLLKHPYDVIHFEFSGLAVAYMDSITALKNKTIVSCRGTAEKVKPLSHPERKVALQKLFSLVDSIHCVSADMANTIRPYCNEDEKIFINRPSVDTNVFRRSKPYRSDLRLTILSIGRLTFQKGYLIGLMAMRSLKAKGVSFLWEVVGDGPEEEEMVYHIHALGLQDCVKMIGRKNRDEIIELYNHADIFLLPSVYEGIANVCLEAMSMELPVLATKSGGMEEVIEHGKDGLLCEIYDPVEIADNIYSIARDYDKRKYLGKNARQKVLHSFTIQKQADVFEEQYYSLVNN